MQVILVDDIITRRQESFFFSNFLFVAIMTPIIMPNKLNQFSHTFWVPAGIFPYYRALHTSPVLYN